MYGKWPGLDREQLNEDRDLALTTDFRDIFAEMLVHHLQCKTTDKIFPRYPIEASRFLGMLGPLTSKVQA